MPRAAAAVVFAAVALLAAGCGSSGSTATGADPGDGKQIFSDAGCASCHTLSAAGANGNGGPNLDDIKASADEVAEQVANGGGGMPSFSGDLTDQQIQAVAKFVAANDGSQ